MNSSNEKRDLPRPKNASIVAKDPKSSGRFEKAAAFLREQSLRIQRDALSDTKQSKRH